MPKEIQKTGMSQKCGRLQKNGLKHHHLHPYVSLKVFLLFFTTYHPSLPPQKQRNKRRRFQGPCSSGFSKPPRFSFEANIGGQQEMSMYRRSLCEIPGKNLSTYRIPNLCAPCEPKLLAFSKDYDVGGPRRFAAFSLRQGS